MEERYHIFCAVLPDVSLSLPENMMQLSCLCTAKVVSWEAVV